MKNLTEKDKVILSYALQKNVTCNVVVLTLKQKESLINYCIKNNIVIDNIEERIIVKNG